MYVTIHSKNRILRADYEGGPYIELTFGHTGFKPTEVINVWDYETSKPQDPALRDLSTQRKAVRKHVKAWMAEMDSEWPEWYEGYLENARY